MNSTSKFKAVFLGSFDPPTIGHLHLISEAISVGAEVFVVPAHSNPWKTGQTSYEVRLEMTKKATEGYDEKVKVLDIEGEMSRAARENYIPTVNVLRELKKVLGEFKVISTNETYSQISGWNKGNEVLAENEFLIFSSSHLGQQIEGSIEILDIPVSSSLVRSLRKEGREILEYVPESVYKIIKENNLYV